MIYFLNYSLRVSLQQDPLKLCDPKSSSQMCGKRCGLSPAGRQGVVRCLGEALEPSCPEADVVNRLQEAAKFAARKEGRTPGLMRKMSKNSETRGDLADHLVGPH